MKIVETEEDKNLDVLVLPQGFDHLTVKKLAGPRKL